MIQELSVVSLLVGRKINIIKSQIRCNRTRCEVEVDGQVIHYADEYTYLGQIASFENRQDKEV